MTVDLRTIPGVELVRTGRWEITTGPWTVTTGDLLAAVAAHRAGVIRRPVLKLGHIDDRFDGEPAIGAVDNLRVTDAGHTLLGDYVGVPAWLADVMASAYPDRSVEAIRDYVDARGTTHRLVLTGVALLGVTAPGISTLRSLADVGALFGVPVAASAPAGGQPVILRASTRPTLTAENRRPIAVRAAAARRRHRNAEAVLASLTSQQKDTPS